MVLQQNLLIFFTCFQIYILTLTFNLMVAFRTILFCIFITHLLLLSYFYHKIHNLQIFFLYHTQLCCVESPISNFFSEYGPLHSMLVFHQHQNFSLLLSFLLLTVVDNTAWQINTQLLQRAWIARNWRLGWLSYHFSDRCFFVNLLKADNQNFWVILDTVAEYHSVFHASQYKSRKITIKSYHQIKISSPIDLKCTFSNLKFFYIFQIVSYLETLQYTISLKTSGGVFYPLFSLFAFTKSTQCLCITFTW